MARLTDQAGNLDTSGTRGGPHTNIAGVAPVFDLAKEQEGRAPKRDLTLDQRFKEAAVAGNNDTSDPWLAHDAASHQQARITDQVPDTTGLDTQAASGKDHETVQALQTDTWDTSGGGQPNALTDGVSSVEDGTSLKGEGSFTAAASQTEGGDEGEAEGDENANEADAEEDPKVAAFSAVPMPDLYKLAREQDPPVKFPAGSDKATAINILIEAGVEPPAGE